MTVALESVRVLLFASYAERLGLESVEVRLPLPATVREVLDRVRSLPGGNELPSRPLCALNWLTCRWTTR